MQRRDGVHRYLAGALILSFFLIRALSKSSSAAKSAISSVPAYAPSQSPEPTLEQLREQTRQRCMEVYRRDLSMKETSPYEWEVMMTPELVNAICGLLFSNATVLEWGTGGSTILFSQFAAEYWAVEHDKAFGKFVTQKLIPKLPADVEKGIHYFVVTNESAYYWTPTKDGSYQQFENYILLPGGFCKQFDVILIDGRARVECARFVLRANLLKPDGVVLIHDWERPHYKVVLDWYDEIALSSPRSPIRLGILKPKPGVLPPPPE